MYKHSDVNDCYFSLHDCRAEKIYFDNGILSFVFPNGFWVTQQHPQNKSIATVRTDLSQVDFQMIDETVDGIEILIFRKIRVGKAICENWEPENFINAVNAGTFRIEFITQYKSFQSILLKCWIWFDQSSYHRECEIILNTDGAIYNWNKLCYDIVY